jgi:type II secretory pathway component GspD/PulD (secretin)
MRGPRTSASAAIFGLVFLQAISLGAMQVFAQATSTAQAPAFQEVAGAGNAPVVVTEETLTERGIPAEGVPPGADPAVQAAANAAAAASKPAAGAVETIKRPKEPKAPPNKKEFEIKPDEAGLVHFQFRDQAWPDILQWVADVSKLALDWQELPADTLSIHAPGKTSLDETRDMINRHLLARGFTILEFPGVLQVVKTQGINVALVPRVAPEELAKLPSNRYVRTTFTLKTLIAKEVVDELKPLISSNGTLQALSNTNRLEAIDTASNLAQIHAVISEEQSEAVLMDLAREFPLEHVRATEVREQLAVFLKLEGAKGAGSAMEMSPEMEMQQQQMMMMQQQQLAAQQAAMAGQPGMPEKKRREIYLVANPRRNSLIVNAPPDKMAIIASFISRVDVSNPNEQYQALTTRMKVYRLSSLEPKQFVASLLALNVLEPTTRLEVDDKNKSMIAYASLADHLTIQETIKKLDGSARQVEVLQLRRLRAEEVAGTIRLLMGIDGEKKEDNSRRRFFYFDPFQMNNKESKSSDQLRIGANAVNNQIILWANEFETAEIKKLLVKLGELPPEGGSDQRVRVIEASRSQETREYLERLKRYWESNGIELEIPDAGEFEDKPPSGSPKKDPPAPVLQGGEIGAIDGTQEALFPQVRLVATQQDGTQEPLGNTSGAGTGIAGTGVDGTGVDGTGTAVSGTSNSGTANSGVEPKKKIVIKLDPQGNLVLESPDTKALDRVEEWMISNAPPEQEYQVFKIEHTRPFWIKLNLEDYFKEDGKDKKNSNDTVFRYLFDLDPPKQEYEGPQLGKKRKLKFMSDSDSGTLLVSGASPAQLDTIRRLIELWDRPTEEDKQSLRYSKTIKVEYSKAQSIVDAIKDAFRDLLSSNDKALEKDTSESAGGAGGKEPKQRSRDSISDGGMNFEFTGRLSLGVDSLTNTIIVSAKGEDLLELISELIEELDQKAKRSEQVEVVKVNGASTVALEKALKNLLRTNKGANGRNPQNMRLTPGANGQVIQSGGFDNGQSPGGAVESEGGDQGGGED